jgi:hypothetical protein
VDNRTPAAPDRTEAGKPIENRRSQGERLLHAGGLIAAIGVLAFFFANVEIQIEGADGWAAKLPVTFRIEHHWLLDWFWGGRPMTGYHAWVFPFILLFCHLPMAFMGRWSWRLEARSLACAALFWISEDALWFVLNPAFGWSSLYPGNPQVWWHHHWFLGLPTDYWTFTAVGLGLMGWSFGGRKRTTDSP